ncbi:tyrosine-type recombinase/integrase [Aliiroseovarius sp. KMU-50]|uniref:Tyrosine-type recombinase/integrase n=1 Tax=Aliiroseovarius salicola TaxID=3009082 RepID=A0ABT4W3A5_9RHOB|nr:site-specific integrase [Aliiroseovarius sp. KMU-50]MDA5095008.1 tyrosine-type recombinase/integrase [Aliiroseovarius sp. KMU-50]
MPKHKKQSRQTLFSFSATALESLEPDERDYYVRDTKTPGLVVKVTPAGKKVFILRYRMPGKGGRKLTFGPFPRVSVPQARKLAREAWLDIANGEDPATKKSDLSKVVTVKNFAQRYLQEQVAAHASPSTARDYASMLYNHVIPAIGNMKLDEVQRVDVEKIHLGMRSTPTRANRTLAVMKAMFNKAGDWGLLPYGKNPAVRIRLFKEKRRQRFFDTDEQRRIARAISELREEYPRSQSAFDAIKFMFRTGCRTKEALNLRWEDISFEREEALLRQSKTGERKLYLGDAAIRLLQSIASTSNSEWVFPGRSEDKPLERLKRPWEKICNHARLRDARVHDIRHTVATYLSTHGRKSSATEILGHTNSKTTDLYSHPIEGIIREDLNGVISMFEKSGI